MKKTSTPAEPPIGIIITMGKEVVDANGGMIRFIRHFESCVRDEDSGLWLHKSRMQPQQDIATVYVVIMNKVLYKVFYGGYQSGPTSVFMRSGEERQISWSRMVLSGPFEKAPHDIEMRGFQGFRYIHEPLW